METTSTAASTASASTSAAASASTSASDDRTWAVVTSNYKHGECMLHLIRSEAKLRKFIRCHEQYDEESKFKYVPGLPLEKVIKQALSVGTKVIDRELGWGIVDIRLFTPGVDDEVCHDSEEDKYEQLDRVDADQAPATVPAQAPAQAPARYCCMHYFRYRKDSEIYDIKVCDTFDEVVQYAKSKARLSPSRTFDTGRSNDLLVAFYRDPIRVHDVNVIDIDEMSLETSLELPSSTICEFVWPEPDGVPGYHAPAVAVWMGDAVPQSLPPTVEDIPQSPLPPTTHWLNGGARMCYPD